MSFTLIQGGDTPDEGTLVEKINAIASNTAPALVSFDFSGNFQLITGESYWLVASTDSDAEFKWYSGENDDLSSYWKHNTDAWKPAQGGSNNYALRVNGETSAVAVPEPASDALLGGCLAGVIGVVRLRQKRRNRRPLA